jgi:hypothetical protein
MMKLTRLNVKVGDQVGINLAAGAQVDGDS